MADTLNISPNRRINQATHALMPLELYEVCLRTAVSMAMEGDLAAAQWFFNELVIRDRMSARAAYNSLRCNGKLKHLKGAPCVACGTPSDTIDHIIPLSKGGTNDIDNLQPMCRSCNAKKNDSLPDQQGINRE